MTGTNSVPHEDPASMPIDCPVCPARGLAPDQLRCDNCGTDLSPIRRVRDLPRHSYNQALRRIEAGSELEAVERLHGVLALSPAFTPARILLGKLYWKRGRKDDALAQWRAGAHEQPNDEIVKELVAAAEREQSQQRTVGGTDLWGRRPTLVAAALAIAVACGWIARTLVPVEQATTVQIPNTESPTGPPPALAELSNTRPEGDRAQTNTQPETSDRPLQQVRARLADVQGIDVYTDASSVRVVPSDQLFSPGETTPNESGAALLTQLRSVISHVDTNLLVIVTGYADSLPLRPGSRWHSNDEIASLRSLGAQSILQDGGGRHRFVSGTPDRSSERFASLSGKRTVELEISLR